MEGAPYAAAEARAVFEEAVIRRRRRGTRYEQLVKEPAWG